MGKWGYNPPISADMGPLLITGSGGPTLWLNHYFGFFTKESVGNMIQFDYLLKWVAQPPPFPVFVWQGHILLYGTLVLLIFVDGEKASGKANQE